MSVVNWAVNHKWTIGGVVVGIAVLLMFLGSSSSASSSSDAGGYGSLYRQPTDAEVNASGNATSQLIASNLQSQQNQLEAALASKSLDVNQTLGLAALSNEKHSFDLNYNLAQSRSAEDTALAYKQLENDYNLGFTSIKVQQQLGMAAIEQGIVESNNNTITTLNGQEAQKQIAAGQKKASKSKSFSISTPLGGLGLSF